MTSGKQRCTRFSCVLIRVVYDTVYVCACVRAIRAVVVTSVKRARTNRTKCEKIKESLSESAAREMGHNAVKRAHL